MGLPILPRMTREDRIIACSFRNSLSREGIREITAFYFVSLEVKIAIPRIHDDVLHPSSGSCTIYVDHLKTDLRLPLYSL